MSEKQVFRRGEWMIPCRFQWVPLILRQLQRDTGAEITITSHFLICKIKLQNRGWQFYSEPLGQKWKHTHQT